MSDTITNNYEENFPLTIKKKDVGLFIGPKGKDLKKHVIFESKDRIRSKFDVDEVNGLFCMVQTNDDNDDVSVLLKTQDERFLEIMKDCIIQHQKRIMTKSKKRNEMSKFVFKTDMEHHKIGKFIGNSGSGISRIRQNVSSEDDCSNIKIMITEDKRIKIQRMKFEILKTDFKCGEKVLITVTLNTKDREKTFEVLRNHILNHINFVNDCKEVTLNPGSPEVDEDEEDTWGNKGLSEEDQKKFSEGW